MFYQHGNLFRSSFRRTGHLLEDLGLEKAEVVLADRPLDDGHEAVQESRYVGSGGRDLSQHHQHFSLDETLGLRDYAYVGPVVHDMEEDRGADIPSKT